MDFCFCHISRVCEKVMMDKEGEEEHEWVRRKRRVRGRKPMWKMMERQRRISQDVGSDVGDKSNT